MSQVQKPHYWIQEWCRDSEDIRDLLQAYGEDCPGQPAEERERLLAILNEIGPERAAGVLYQFAQGFALMLDDIVDFCEQLGISIAGQIHLPGGEPFGRGTALNTGWARSGRTVWTEDITRRATQLVTEFAQFGVTIRAEDLIDTGQELTAYGRDLRQDTRRPQLRLPGLTHRRIRQCSKSDLDALEVVLGLLDEVEGTLVGAGIPGGTDAIATVRDRIRNVIAELIKLRPSKDGKTAPELTLMAAGITEVGGALRRLAEQVSEAERDTRGLHDFVRSEFWGQRWRIFELWVFIRVLRILSAAGGQLEPLNSVGGVWHLRYSKASEPVLLCHFGAETVRVYYQLHREGTDRANMPDIALETGSEDKQMVAVIDPKHGPTHLFPEVHEVLLRYATAFGPDFTAVVNYTPMQTYGLTNLGGGESQRLLVSDLAPGTVNSRRFELRLEECIITRFATKASAPALVRGTPERQQNSPPHSAALLYVAARAREVDEPDGLWIVPDGSGASPVRGLQPKAGLPSDASIFWASPAPDGRVAVLGTEAGIFLLQESGQATSLREDQNELVWKQQGDRVFFMGSHRLYDRRGKELGTLPAGMPKDRYWWENDVLCRLSPSRGKLELFVASLDNDAAWRPVAVSTCRGDFEFNLLRDPESRDLIAYSGGSLFRVRLLPEPSIEEYGDRMSFPRATSPSGRRGIVPGPYSKRKAVLLRFLDTDGSIEFPLVRFMEPNHAAVEAVRGKIAFSPDENRIAFIVGRHEQARVLTAKVGDRYAIGVSLSDQRPSGPLCWISSRMARLLVF